MVHSQKHFLLVSFPAFGHIIPLLELGKKLKTKHNVTFAVSECMLEKITQRELVSQDDFPVIGIPDGFREIEFDPDTVSDRRTFDTMYNSIMPGAKKLLTEVPAVDKKSPSHGITLPVDCVIGDNLFAEPLTVCYDRGIPYHTFNTASIGMTLNALIVNDDTPVLPDGNDGGLGFFEPPVPGAAKPPGMPAPLKTMFLPIHKTMHKVSGIIVNSVREMDQDMINALQSFPVMKNVPLRFVGPLVPADKISDVNLAQQHRVKNWLNNQQPQSVIYVSFGSLGFPSPDQIGELIKGLLQLKKPFIFSLAVGQHKHLPTDVTAKMATQFEDGQYLILPWAPQKMILQHPATSVFLSHCGWNSTLEGVFCGLPIVAWPMFADQKMNGQWLVKQGIAVMVEGTGMKPTRTVPADEIASVIQKVGWNGASTETTYRVAAESWKQKVNGSDGSHGSANAEFEDLLNSLK